jgi:hypothetical protein
VGRGSKERRIYMADAAFAKLLFLEAKGPPNPDGSADDIVLSRADGVIFERVRGMRQDDVFEFDERFLPFVNQAPIVVLLDEVHEELVGGFVRRGGEDRRLRARPWRTNEANRRPAGA